MTGHRSATRTSGVVLAILALFGLVALAGWHSAGIHDGARHAAVAMHPAHGTLPPDDDGGKDPVHHLLAHATGQWLPGALPSVAPALVVLAERIWPTRAMLPPAGIGTARPLRPPRG